MEKEIKILIVDDEPNVVNSLKIILEENYETITAYNGIEAIDKASKEKPDLVLLDICLPEMDGFEILKRLKSFPLDVIIVSVVNNMEAVFKAVDLGAYDYFTKPFEVDVVRMRVRRTLEKQTLEKENTYLKEQVKARMLKQGFLGREFSYREAKEVFERNYLKEVLESTNWNQVKAAKLIKVHRNTLLNKMWKLGLRKPEKKGITPK